MSKEKELKERLIKLDDEYECSIASREQREPEEISDDAFKVINELIADKNITDINNEEDAHDYVDWYKERY
jgi:hypothetical protein